MARQFQDERGNEDRLRSFSAAGGLSPGVYARSYGIGIHSYFLLVSPVYGVPASDEGGP